MENGQEEKKEESVSVEVKEDKPADDAVDAVDKSDQDKNDQDKSENDKNKPENDKTASEDKEDETKEKKAEEPTAELLQKIRNQVEYYFGDVNMQKDKFLIQQTKLDEGWVPMFIMLNFKMLASLSTDTDVILKALESSDLMEISEDRKKIRRSPKHPLPVYNEEYRKAQEAKTVYVKGFPLQGTTIEKLRRFFDDYEPHENIVLRKYLDNDKKFHFKGSIFIQFKSLEDAKAFMARETIKYENTELIRKWSADYCQMKEKEKEERRQKKSDKKKNDINKQQDGQEEDKAENEKDEKINDHFAKGSIIHIPEVALDISRDDIKQKFGELQATVAYIDFKDGKTEAWVRLDGENSAKAILEKMDDGKIEIKKHSISCRLLEGDEEEKYFIKAKQDKANNRKYIKTKLGRKGRGGRGRKRRHSPNREEVSAKKAAN